MLMSDVNYALDIHMSMERSKTGITVPELVGWFVGCLTSQQHVPVSQGRIYSDNCSCCHTEIEVADPTFYLTGHSILTPGQPVPALTL